MDEFQVRLAFLAAGIVIGTVLGMVYSTMRNTKRTRQSTERMEKRLNENGAINLTTIGMVIALVVVVASLFSTLNTNRQVAETQDQLAQNAVIRDKENNCTASILFSTVDALNQRTEYTGVQADANVKLQRSQLRFLRVLAQSNGEGDGSAGLEALDSYLNALNTYVKATAEQRSVAQENPYPTQAEYAECLQQARDGGNR